MKTTHKFGDPCVTWIDVVDPEVEELEVLADEYGLADRTFDEAYRRAARPSMRRFEDHVYIVAFSGSLAEIARLIRPHNSPCGKPFDNRLHSGLPSLSRQTDAVSSRSDRSHFA